MFVPGKNAKTSTLQKNTKSKVNILQEVIFIRFFIQSKVLSGFKSPENFNFRFRLSTEKNQICIIINNFHAKIRKKCDEFKIVYKIMKRILTIKSNFQQQLCYQSSHFYLYNKEIMLSKTQTHFCVGDIRTRYVRYQKGTSVTTHIKAYFYTFHMNLIKKLLKFRLST